MDVAVYDAGDHPVVSARPLCEDFGVSFDGLADAGYSLELTLLDFDGAPVSDTVVVPVDVWEGEESIYDVDFPDAIIH